MNISTKAWAIIGGAAALVVVPAGVSFAVVSAHDDFRPGITERAPARAAQPDNSGNARGGMNGPADRAGAQDQMRARDGSNDRTLARDQVQARDGSNCDGDGPVGAPPAAGTNGRGQGMMDGSGPRGR